MSSRHIVHLDADAFFASVEQAADPRLRGKPVAVGGEKRGIIASASYEARQFGVFTPMPTVRARRLCPRLIVVPGDFEKYERFSRWMFSYAQDFTPDVEVSSIDEGYFDLTGARESPVEIADRLRRTIRQSLKITVSEGIGPNKLISQIASKLRKPAGFVQIPTGQEIPFLHPLANSWLPGIGPKTAVRLNTAGLVRIGQIAATPTEFLSLLVGATAPQLKRFANGIDERPVEREAAPAKSYSQQETFAADTTDEPFVEATLRRMADELMAAIRADEKSIRTVTVKVRYNDMAEDQRSESLAEPTDLETEIYPRLRPMLRAAWKRRVSLRMVSLKFANVYDGFGQMLLWEGASTGDEKRERLADAIDRLREEHGRYAIMRGHDLLLKDCHSERSEESPSPGKRSFASPRMTKSRTSIPLRVHSYYSFLDSTLSVEAIVRWAAEHKLPAVGLTDPNLHGAVEFIQTAKAYGVKPILGAEIGDRLYFVENAMGYRNLCRLLSSTPPHPSPLPYTTREREKNRLPSPPSFGGEGQDEGDAGLIIEPAANWPAVHYAMPGDRWKYDIIQSIRTLTLYRQAHPAKKLGGEFHFTGNTHPERAAEIFERCHFEFELGKLQFPAYRPPDGSNPRAFLRRLVLEGARRRYRTVPAQIEEELGIIREVGYEEYFLVVWDILQECRQRGIEWITRGSAADSLVCYCLGISDVCPIRFDLYFRRFLNKERMALNKLPDIDVDFAHDRKDDVLDLIFAKYGREHAAVVGGFSTFQARSALADICKVLGVSEYQVRRFTEKLPHVHARDLPAAVAASMECRDLPVNEPPYSIALQMAELLDGFPRYPKMHPCGVVLSRGPMNELTPCFESAKGYPTTHFDMDSVEAIGLVKIDILAQGGLAAMRDVRESLGGELRLPQQDEPLNDPAVWELIAGGGARAVHHIESPAMISLCRMCNVRDIEGLIAIVSVIRPGAANGEKKLSFTRRYQGLEPVTYPQPSLEACLKSSFGLVVYEEQILQICEAFAGLPGGKADVLRRALAKENWEQVGKLQPEFFANARARGHSEAVIEQVWQLVCGFHGYAFCKAHSTAYGVEAYQSAWLKRYHPAEFMAAVLSNGKGFYRPIVYALECHRLGIPLLPPSVDAPGPKFCVGDGKIRVPVTYISGLSEKTKEQILAAAPFAGIAEVPGTREEKELLMRAGAFDVFGRTRTQQFWEIVRSGFFGCGQKAVPTDVTEPTRQQRLQWESELFGFPASGHPLELHDDIAWDTYVPIAELGRHVGETVTCCGLIIEDRLHSQVTGELMKFLTLADWTGIIETELFADTYKTYGLATVRYPVLEITATVEPYENRRGHSLRVLRAGKPRRVSPHSR